MGMSASQARLLTLTSRLHDIEYKQQALSNTKIRLSNESQSISNKYSNALNAEKLQFKNNSTRTFEDLNLNSLYSTGSSYKLKDKSGNTVLPQSVYDAFKKVSNATMNTGNWINGANYINGRDGYLKDDFIRSMLGISGNFQATMAHFGINTVPDSTNNYYIEGTEPKIYHWHHDKAWDYIVDHCSSCNFTKEDIDYWQSLCSSLMNDANKVQKTAVGHGGGSYTAYDMSKFKVIENQYANNSAWLYNAIQSGQYTLCDMSGREVDISTDTGLSTVPDESNTAKAKAEYDAAINKLNRKEKQIDSQMSRLDTQYSALTTEQSTIKSIISENVESKFKLFG